METPEEKKLRLDRMRQEWVETQPRSSKNNELPGPSNDGIILVFDTETTGLPKGKNPSIYKTELWPHIIQLSYLSLIHI